MMAVRMPSRRVAAEAAQAAQKVQQLAIGDEAHTHGVQGLVASENGAPDILHRFNDIVMRIWPAIYAIDQG